MTDAQRAAVRYWTGAGVLRWNEIQRELVARYNLPPAPRADGSYPLPDAENPFADPGLPLRQSAVRGARVQLRERRAVRGAQGGVVLEVPVQPPVAGADRSGGRHGRAPRATLPALSVGGRRASPA